MTKPMSANEWSEKNEVGLHNGRLLPHEADAYAAYRVREFAERAAELSVDHCPEDKAEQCQGTGRNCFECVAAEIRALAGKE